MVRRVRHIEEYVIVRFVVPKLGLRDQCWKNFS
jgi:hypothetical protein